MPIIELIYDADCPNVEMAREQLRRAFTEVGIQPEWREWNRGTSTDRVATSQDVACGCEWEAWNRQTGEVPPYVSEFGSPTILVDGQDVAGDLPATTPDCCRVYRDPVGGLRGVPSVSVIVAAFCENIDSSQTPDGKNNADSRSWWAVVFAVGMTLLPNVTCPACWPVYMGLLSSLGVGFMVKTAYLMPLTVIFLIVAAGALGFRAKTRRGYAPFFVGLLAATLVIVGKFVVSSDLTWYCGIALLIGASLWNSWPRGIYRKVSCSGCATPETLYQLEAKQGE